MKTTFEMANSDDPKAIIKASQRSILKAMKDVIHGIRDSKEGKNRPGLTWAQIDYLIEGFEKKDAEIFYQEEPL